MLWYFTFLQMSPSHLNCRASPLFFSIPTFESRVFSSLLEVMSNYSSTVSVPKCGESWQIDCVLATAFVRSHTFCFEGTELCVGPDPSRNARSFVRSHAFVLTLCKGGPEPLENEINKILGSKREDRFSDHFSDLVQNIVRFVFRTCFASAFSVRPRGTCESSRRSARR